MRAEPRVLWQGEWSGCWLAQFDPGVPCDGRLVRAHLIPRQVIRREFMSRRAPVLAIPEKGELARLIEDERSWAPACGGPTGIGGHHGRLDGRLLRVPRERLPAALEAFVDELGLGWWLDREYGLWKCDSCDEFPPEHPFPDCKCYS